VDAYDYYTDHEAECEIAFLRSTPDRPVVLPALVYAHVRGETAALASMLERAPDLVRDRFEALVTEPPSDP
jgi:hypothetical protein